MLIMCHVVIAAEDVGAGSIMVSSLAAGGDPAHWMLASTPEFSLQERAPGPSPMELMVRVPAAGEACKGNRLARMERKKCVGAARLRHRDGYMHGCS